MLLAGDLGGTKTHLGLFEPGGRRPRPTEIRAFITQEFGGLADIVEAFLSDCRVDRDHIEAVTIGVAGPVDGNKAALTNVPWRIDAHELSERLRVGPITLLNDVEAMAHCVATLDSAERVVLQPGRRDLSGSGALLSIGTGVGMALLHRRGERFVPLASEGGHADFAARTDREIAVVRMLRAEYGRVEVERVVSGRGLSHLARATHDGRCERLPEGLAVQDEPAYITRAGLDGTCSRCREALDLFAEALGAVAGNLALTAKATGGVYLGGGVPAKILPALRTGTFLAAFLDKAPLDALVQRVPVEVITLGEAGLVGAAVHANQPRAAGCG